MPRSYVLAELAQAELEDILRYIARRGDVDMALRVEDEFRIEFRRLAENPLIGYHRSDIPSVYRVWGLYDYLIIYKPETRPLQILRLWHGARRPPRL